MVKTAGSWQPGQSGNPGGRPKEVGHVRDLARQHTEAAIETLAAIMNDADEKAPARVAAAEALLARGWGKSIQTMEGKFEFDRPSPRERSPNLVKALERAKLIRASEGVDGASEAPINGADNPPEIASADRADVCCA